MTKRRPELAAGIDASARTLHVCLEGDVRSREFDNDAKGHKELLRWLRKGRRRVRVVVEATGLYHLDVALAISARPGLRVSVVNPRATKNFQAARNVRAKTDRVDARSLCEFAQRMPFVDWKVPKALHLEMRTRVRHVEQLIKDHTRLTNRLHALDASKSTPDYVREHTKQHLAFVHAQIDAAKEALTAFVAEHSEMVTRVRQLATIPGVAEWTALRLVGTYLLLDPTMTSSEITAWAGLDPRPQESGTSVGGQRRISKRGSSRIRAALYMPAVTAATHNQPLKRLYERVTATKPDMVGVVAVMRKLLIISWAMYRTETDWDLEKASPRTVKNRKAA